MRFVKRYFAAGLVSVLAAIPVWAEAKPLVVGVEFNLN